MGAPGPRPGWGPDGPGRRAGARPRWGRRGRPPQGSARGGREGAGAVAEVVDPASQKPGHGLEGWGAAGAWRDPGRGKGSEWTPLHAGEELSALLGDALGL